MLQRCTRLLQTAVCSRTISTTSTKHGVDEFFPEQLLRNITETAKLGDKKNNHDSVDVSDKDLSFGRGWEKSDLESLKSPVLHSLWYVLLKERNKCLTADAYHRQKLGKTSPYNKRLESVQRSIENLKEVIEQRELHIDTVKTHLWMKRVSNLLGPDYAQELAATYVTYTQPHTQHEQKEWEEMKHHQMFDSYFNRIRQPYDQWDLQFETPKQSTTVTEWEEKLKNYESDTYFPEDDFEPGLEGFLHNIKRGDWEELERDPKDMVESRDRRENDRLKIIKRIWDKRLPADTEAELKNLKRWKARIEISDGSISDTKEPDS